LLLVGHSFEGGQGGPAIFTLHRVEALDPICLHQCLDSHFDTVI